MLYVLLSMLVTDYNLVDDRLRATQVSGFRVSKYSMSTGTNTLWKHLCSCHIEEWVKQCDEKKLVIGGKEAQATITDYRQQSGEVVGTGTTQHSQVRLSFTNENFIQAINKFVVSDDQVRCLTWCHMILYWYIAFWLKALNILENRSFWDLLLLMCNDLRDSDIPHCFFLCTQIMSNWEQHLIGLQNEMNVRV